MKSILQADESYCYLCGENGGYWGLDTHHVFGAGLRKKSEKYGLKVRLCHEKCHLGGVHKDGELAKNLKRYAQIHAMRHYGWDIREWMEIFGENYL